MIIGRGGRIGLASLAISLSKRQPLALGRGMLGDFSHYKVSRDGVDDGQSPEAAKLDQAA